MAEFTTVFLSSTAKDLQPWRDAVHAAIGKMSGLHCVRMEDFGAIDAAPVEVCRQKVAECDLFVGLVGHFFGSRPEGSELSYTQIEYEEAKDRKKPRLLFLADDDFPLSPRLGREPEEAYDRQVAFRAQVQSERTIVRFHEPDKLATFVVAALQSYLEQARRPGRLPGASTSSSAIEGAGSAGPSLAAIRESYLLSLLRETGFLDLTGIDPAAAQDRDARFSLEALYTALLTLSPTERGGLGWVAESLPEAGREPRRISALEQLNRHMRLVLLGDPGSGKSTFVNFVVLCMAGELLGREEVNLRVLTAPLAKDEERHLEESQPQSWDHGALFPVRIVLRDFAARGLPAPGEKAAADHLWIFLASELRRSGLPEAYPLMRKELLEGRGLVLLDGLDEVPEAERCRQQLCQVIESFSGSLGKSRVLLTSRTYAYQNPRWRILGFVEAVLAPFSRGQIDRFIGLWYEQMVALGRLKVEDARGRAELLRRGIFASDRILGLAERPLLLTLIAGLHAARGGTLPERRGELYAEAVELLLNTWELKRWERDEHGRPVLAAASLAEWLKVDRGEVRQVLDTVAFEAHAAQSREHDTADVDEGKLVGRLLHLRRNPGSSTDADAVALVAYLRDRAGLLVERGEGVYTFPHRTFQEYLAACHLTARNYPKAAAKLGREDPGRWREVVLLAGAKAARGAMASVWSLADSLCFRDPSARGSHAAPDAPAAETADEWGALLAGQTLAESADLSTIDPEDLPKLQRVQRWLLALMRREYFPPRERAAAGKALATLGDTRFKPERWFLPDDPLLGFVEVPEGPFRMGSAKSDRMAVENERPQHEVNLSAFWIARFPVTVAQFRAFVEESGHSLQDSRCLEGVSNAPVVLVTWYDALAYCRWLEDKLAELASRGEMGGLFGAPSGSGALRASVPSEAEWEKAARGLNGRIFPWGDEADPNRANYYDTGLFETSSVGAFPGGESVFGCEGLSGNVWEWTRSLWGEASGKPQFPYPYRAGDGRENLEAPREVLRVLRGGAFFDVASDVRCGYRLFYLPGLRRDHIGFRVVLSPFPL
jgi:formylglycine-generating enzyme required for sulfatase activity